LADFTFNWRGAEVINSTKRAAANGLEDGAEFILGESNADVPHQEGTLEGSGDTSIDRESLEATIFYDTPYAVRQHEDMSLQHPGSRHAQYLELALATNHDAVLNYIAAQIKAAMGG
jgi:hypothetical protein